MYRTLRFTALVLMLLSLRAWAQLNLVNCEHVGGVLITNISTVPLGSEGTNLGPAFGDLAGSVAAEQVNTNPIQFQHYWVTSTGDTIKFAPATLTPASTDDPYVVAVRWGNYRSVITGGTGKFKGASGYLDYFGIADFNSPKKGDDGSRGLTLVLRYSGQVCYGLGK